MIFRQEPSSRNMTSNNDTMLTNFKNDNVGEEQFQMKGKDPMMMPSSNHFQQQQNPNGLTRYRSAPSTFFTSYLDGLNVNNNNNNSDSSQDGDNEAGNMFSAFMGSSSNMSMQNPNDLQRYSSNLKQEFTEYNQQENGLLSVDNFQIDYESLINGGYGGRIDENQLQTARGSYGNSSNSLLRQSSSPAGFFVGFDMSKEIHKFRSIGQSNSTSNGVSNQLSFKSFQSTAPPSFTPSIAEITGTGSSKDPNGISYIPNSFNDSSSRRLKRNHEGDLNFSSFNALETESHQKGDYRNVSHGLLTHHLSLPKTSSEMSVKGKYLEFQQDNVVACKMRAKRGFATHPRSIAERVRRTRISVRMKKLQELFPNMDKQANTSDMLDLAVDHIKELQKQVQTLTEVKEKCKCLR